MAKRINIVVNNCAECPYSSYDPKYGMSYNSGFDCEYVGRIREDDRGHPKLEDMNINEGCPLDED